MVFTPISPQTCACANSTLCYFLEMFNPTQPFHCLSHFYAQKKSQQVYSFSPCEKTLLLVCRPLSRENCTSSPAPTWWTLEILCCATQASHFPQKKAPITASEMPQSEKTQSPILLHPEVTYLSSQKTCRNSNVTPVSYYSCRSFYTHSNCTEPPAKKKLSKVMQGILCVCVYLIRVTMNLCHLLTGTCIRHVWFPAS